VIELHFSGVFYYFILFYFFYFFAIFYYYFAIFYFAIFFYNFFLSLRYATYKFEDDRCIYWRNLCTSNKKLILRFGIALIIIFNLG